MFTNPNESQFLLSSINNNTKVLEYGSGESTLEISNICKEIISIEHDKNWYNKNIDKLPNNCKLFLIEPNLPYTEGFHCGTYEEFKDYIEYPKRFSPFDVIFIDGRARVGCSSICRLLGDENTIVFIHDFNREEYQESLNYLELIDMVGTMAKFKIKNKI